MPPMQDNTASRQDVMIHFIEKSLGLIASQGQALGRSEGLIDRSDATAQAACVKVIEVQKQLDKVRKKKHKATLKIREFTCQLKRGFAFKDAFDSTAVWLNHLISVVISQSEARLSDYQKAKNTRAAVETALRMLKDDLTSREDVAGYLTSFLADRQFQITERTISSPDYLNQCATQIKADYEKLHDDMYNIPF